MRRSLQWNAGAFMLDLANRFGDGGAKSIYTATAGAGQTAADHISALQMKVFVASNLSSKPELETAETCF